MTVQVDPRRAFVVAVGLERYDYGPTLNLPGAAVHALRFVTWALSCGVPPERVHLASTWLEKAPAPPPGVAVSQTTRDGLESLFQHVMQVGGDLLLLYWCGHGSMNERRQRVLYTSNATAGNELNVSVEQLLLLLSSSKGPGFARQIIIIDACANFLDEMNTASLPTSGMSVGHHREAAQFVLFSAAGGQIAQFRRGERRALFSTEVLAWLEQHAGSTFPPEVSALEEHVREAFERLRLSDPALRQSPVSFQVKPYVGEGTWHDYSGGMPVSGATQQALDFGTLTPGQVHRVTRLVLACSFANPDRAEVMRAIAEGRPDELFDQLRSAAATASDVERLAVEKAQRCWQRQVRVAPALRALSGASLEQTRLAFYRALPNDPGNPLDLDMAMDLAADYGDIEFETTPLKFFVALLEQLTGTPVADDWFELPRDRLLALRAEATAALEVTEARLVVDLRTPGTGAGAAAWPTQVTGYLRIEGKPWTKLGRPVPCAATMEDAQGATRVLIDRAFARGIADFTIGFVLPRAVFDTRPESWPYATVIGDAPLREQHPVVLHCGERLGRRREQALATRRAVSIRTSLRDHPASVAWVEADQRGDGQALRARLSRSDKACVALAFALERFDGDFPRDPILATVAAGAPYVVWVEEEPEDWERARRDLEDLVTRGPFGELPNRVFAAGAGDEALSRGVRVMWDEPEALPPFRR